MMSSFVYTSPLVALLRAYNTRRFVCVCAYNSQRSGVDVLTYSCMVVPGRGLGARPGQHGQASVRGRAQHTLFTGLPCIRLSIAFCSGRIAVCTLVSVAYSLSAPLPFPFIPSPSSSLLQCHPNRRLCPRLCGQTVRECAVTNPRTCWCGGCQRLFAEHAGGSRLSWPLFHAGGLVHFTDKRRTCCVAGSLCLFWSSSSCFGLLQRLASF